MENTFYGLRGYYFGERETCFFIRQSLVVHMTWDYQHSCHLLNHVDSCSFNGWPWHIVVSQCCEAHIIKLIKSIELQEGLFLLFWVSHRIPNIIHKLEDDMWAACKVFSTAPLAMNFGNVFQLLGEWSMQGLRWDLQPVGDVCCGAEHVFKGQGLFSDSAPEDKQSRSPGGVKRGKKRGQMWRDRVSERGAEAIKYIIRGVMHMVAVKAGYIMVKIL